MKAVKLILVSMMLIAHSVGYTQTNADALSDGLWGWSRCGLRAIRAGSLIIEGVNAGSTTKTFSFKNRYANALYIFVGLRDLDKQLDSHPRPNLITEHYNLRYEIKALGILGITVFGYYNIGHYPYLTYALGAQALLWVQDLWVSYRSK
jgi:hypothetical protein